MIKDQNAARFESKFGAIRIILYYGEPVLSTFTLCLFSTP